MIELKQFAEDYAPLLLKIYPKSIELYMSIIAYANNELRLDYSLSSINKKLYSKRSPWNATDKKARDILVSFGLLRMKGGITIATSQPLSAANRLELYWSHGMYDSLLDVLEDDILRRKAYKEALNERLGRATLRTEVITKMGLNPTEVMEALGDLKDSDPARYKKITGNFRVDEDLIQNSIAKLKIFKGGTTQTVRIPKGADLTEVDGIDGYKIPHDLKYDEDTNSYWSICDIEYCKMKGHVDRAGNPIPISSWKVFQFLKVFLDEFYIRFNSNYPDEPDGVLIKKELDAQASLRKGHSVWKKKGQRISRLFKDIQTVMTAMKDNKKTNDYIKWWFRSGIVEKKSAEYTSGWLRSPLMMTAFMRHETGPNGSVKNSALSKNIVSEICSLDGFLKKNHERIPETVNDIKLLVEQLAMFDLDDPRKMAVEICRREGII